MIGDGRVTAVVAGGFSVERLVCHGRLPLIAGLDSGRAAVHVWEAGPGGLRHLATVDGEAYPDEPWERHGLAPEPAWHPRDPVLVVPGFDGPRRLTPYGFERTAVLRRWSPDGVEVMTGLPTGASYRFVAFSPDGSALWASPSSLAGDHGGWGLSDAVNLATGAVRTMPAWDTDLVEHPGGGLYVTLSSDQARTDLLFAKPDGDGGAAGLRLLRHSITLDADGYQHPVFSPDGRYLAIRGNNYEHSLGVFEFPALRTVLRTTLGEISYDEGHVAWSWHNIAFAHSGTLLVGTPRGSVIELDLEQDRATEHHVTDAPISALATLPTGRLAVADRSGRLLVIDNPGVVPQDGPTRARDRVGRFLAATTELADDGPIRTDGERTWTDDDLDAVTTAEDSDPTWFRHRAAINHLFQPR